MIRERWGTGTVGGGACRGQSGRGLGVLPLRRFFRRVEDIV